MANQILVPSLGESITEATVSKWFKQVGEKVESDEPLVELESDKVNLEIPSPAAGTLSSINITEGNVVEVGALLGIINGGKSRSATTANKENAYQKPYVPPKTTEKKTTGKKSKKTESKKQIPLQLVDTAEEESKKEKPLILDNLADSETEDTDASIENEVEKKYVPPKTKKNLSPAVRKIAEENQIDITNLEGSGKDGRIIR